MSEVPRGTARDLEVGAFGSDLSAPFSSGLESSELLTAFLSSGIFYQNHRSFFKFSDLAI